MGFLETAGAEIQSGGSGGLTGMLLTFGLPVIFIAFMYFAMIRPQRKKEKQSAEMRKNIEVGDQVTTIGGIVGKVVSIKEDIITIETGGADRNKIKLQRWAINSNDKTQ